MPGTVACLSEIDRLMEGGNAILLAADFDGTLCPMADCPDDVVVPNIIQGLLLELSKSRRLVVAVISGRALDDLIRRLPLPLIFGGNCGLAIQGPAFRFEHPEARRLQPQLAKICKHIIPAIAQWQGAWVEDKTLTAAVHYRHVDKAERYALIRAVRKCVFAHDHLFGLWTGREAIEIHPRVAWDKGACLRWIKNKLNMQSNASICIGDDPTDESMFGADINQMNIKVGTFSRSAASFHVSDVFEVAALLAHLDRAIRTESSETSLNVAPASQS